MYSGWLGISGDSDDEAGEKAFLESLGVVVHGEVYEGECSVEMTDEVFSKLEPFWGQFVWDLKHTE